jgi:hypothetical protein
LKKLNFGPPTLGNGETYRKRVSVELFKKGKLAPDLRIRRDGDIFIMFPPFDGLGD